MFRVFSSPEGEWQVHYVLSFMEHMTLVRRYDRAMRSLKRSEKQDLLSLVRLLKERLSPGALVFYQRFLK